MDVCDGEFTPNREVSELRWLPPDQAAEQLSFDRDREILARL
jgi:8-oxo-dGTP diphosphatase